MKPRTVVRYAVYTGNCKNLGRILSSVGQVYDWPNKETVSLVRGRKNSSARL